MAKAAPATSGPIRRAPGLPSLKLILFTLIVAGLGGLVGFEISREAAPATPTPAANRLALPTPRPALGRDEQAYIEELWPVHTAVERTAVRVALGASFYKLNDLNRTDLKVRLADALTAYRAARERLLTLHPPQSMQARHGEYLTAVRLFEQSTLEMLRMFDDGDEAHLATGFPLSVDGTDRIREVGQEFWPDEYPPN